MSALRDVALNEHAGDDGRGPDRLDRAAYTTGGGRGPAPRYSSLAVPPRPATRGERMSTTAPAHSTAMARTSRVTNPAPARSRSLNAVIPITMLTSGLMMTLAVRDAVIGPACSALCNRNNPDAPLRASRYGSQLANTWAQPPSRSSAVRVLVRAAL